MKYRDYQIIDDPNPYGYYEAIPDDDDSYIIMGKSIKEVIAAIDEQYD